MASHLDSELALEIHLAMLVGVLLVTALLVAVFAQLSYKQGIKDRQYAEKFLIIAGSAGSGFLALKVCSIIGISYSDAVNFAGLVGLLTFVGCYWVLQAFNSANPPLQLLK